MLERYNSVALLGRKVYVFDGHSRFLVDVCSLYLFIWNWTLRPNSYLGVESMQFGTFNLFRCSHSHKHINVCLAYQRLLFIHFVEVLEGITMFTLCIEL